MRLSPACWLVILLAGCGRRAPDATVDRQARSFLIAASSTDSVALGKTVADSQPIKAVKAIRRQDSTAVFSDSLLRFSHGDIRGDTAKYFYRLGHNGRDEQVTVGLLRHDNTWRVYYVGFPDRQ